MCDACAGLSYRVKLLEQRMENFAHLPAWYGDIQKGIQEVASVCHDRGWPADLLWRYYHDHTSHRVTQERRRLIVALHQRGWSVSRIALIGRISERAARRALQGVPVGGLPIAPGGQAANCGGDE